MNNNIWFCWVTLTVIIAMILRIIPWSDALVLYNPDWILLTLMYWSVALPERVGIFYAWSIGILTDALLGQHFGVHALSYSLIIYTCFKLHKRLRQYPLIQQAFFVFFCLFSSQILFFFLKNLRHPLPLSTEFWLPILTGTACWPLIYFILQAVRLIKLNKQPFKS